MSSRRGRGEGSISQRQSDGLWTARVDLGFVDGKRKRKQIYGKTRKEVAEKLKVLLRDQQQGLPIATERQTLEQFLTRWLAEVVAARNRPKTHHSYSEIARLHILPTLGKIQLSKLTPQDVQGLLSHKSAAGLSARTVGYIRAVLRMALGQALKWGLVARNVATLVTTPRAERMTINALTPTQSRALLEAARGDRLEALYRVALSLGLRRGEALGLRWSDIDLEARTLRVEVALGVIDGKLVLGEPKTETSRRTLPLPAALVPALRTHHARQLEERLAAGGKWQDTGYVFTSSVGTPIHPGNLMKSFHALLGRAGLPRIRFHDLRHSCASLLAAQGVPARVAMEVLGHSDIRITQNIYTHVFDEARHEATDAIDRALGDAGSTDDP